MSTISPTSENSPQKPTWYVYDQFSFDPIAEFQFPTATAGQANKEVQYRRAQLPGAAGNRLYSRETFSGETPDSPGSPDDLTQLGRYSYFYSNQRNDITSLLKHNGQSLHSYLYDEYGLIYDNNKKPRNASNFTDPHNAYTFSGKEFDEESGLSYFGARSYDPWSGTWITQDTYRGKLTDPASLHRYGFVENNPINRIDEYGFQAISINVPDVSGYSWNWFDTDQNQSVPFGISPELSSIPSELGEIISAKGNNINLTPNARVIVDIMKKEISIMMVPTTTQGQGCRFKIKERDQRRCLVFFETVGSEVITATTLIAGGVSMSWPEPEESIFEKIRGKAYAIIKPPINFASGLSNEYLNNLSLGLHDALTPPSLDEDTFSYQLGRKTGQAISIAQGAAEIGLGVITIIGGGALEGGGLTLCGATGVGCFALPATTAVSGSAIAGGTALAGHGGGMIYKAVTGKDGGGGGSGGSTSSGNPQGSGNIKNVKFINENLLKQRGLDAHAIKTEFLGDKNIAHYDLYKQTDTGEILIFGKGGVGEPIFTNIFIK